MSTFRSFLSTFRSFLSTILNLEIILVGLTSSFTYETKGNHTCPEAPKYPSQYLEFKTKLKKAYEENIVLSGATTVKKIRGEYLFEHGLLASPKIPSEKRCRVLRNNWRAKV